jgi:hypothetical protein
VVAGRVRLGADRAARDLGLPADVALDAADVVAAERALDRVAAPAIPCAAASWIEPPSSSPAAASPDARSCRPSVSVRLPGVAAWTLAAALWGLPPGRR